MPGSVIFECKELRFFPRIVVNGLRAAGRGGVGRAMAIELWIDGGEDFGD